MELASDTEFSGRLLREVTRALGDLELDRSAQQLVRRQLSQMAEEPSLRAADRELIELAVRELRSRVKLQARSLLDSGVQTANRQQILQAMKAMCSIPPICYGKPQLMEGDFERVPSAGDWVEVASGKSAARTALVAGVVGNLLSLRWVTGGQTTLIPGPGTLWVIAKGTPGGGRAKPRTPSAGVVRGGPDKRVPSKRAATAKKPLGERAAAKKPAASKRSPTVSAVPKKATDRRASFAKAATKKAAAKKTSAKKAAKISSR